MFFFFFFFILSYLVVITVIIVLIFLLMINLFEGKVKGGKKNVQFDLIIKVACTSNNELSRLRTFCFSNCVSFIYYQVNYIYIRINILYVFLEMKLDSFQFKKPQDDYYIFFYLEFSDSGGIYYSIFSSFLFF